MSGERKDYAVLTSLAMREEAEIAAAALRANGIDAFIGNSEMATMHWGTVQAMGGLQIMVPASRLGEAKDFLRERLSDVAEDSDEDYDPTRRKDRWKAWVLLIWIVGPIAGVIVIGVAMRLLAFVQGLLS